MTFNNNEIISNNFIESLIAIYNLDIINVLLEFVQGEQAVLFAIHLANVNKASDLALKLNITKSRMTIIINNLIKKSYLKTTQCLEDRRVKLLELTDEGLNHIRAKEFYALEIMKEYILKMGNEDIKILTKLLKKTARLMRGEKND